MSDFSEFILNMEFFYCEFENPIFRMNRIFVIKIKRSQLGMQVRLVDFSMRLMMRVSQIINPSSKTDSKTNFEPVFELNVEFDQKDFSFENNFF